ncbi:hypothetical protein PE067_13580, partial [Paracoccus sp. DMF-8]|uniref:hypothetical protein n=1 Tax=Paracoccus sp. DMF-8 TaxID=3019445 RepID=UPI0023E766F3
VHVLLRLKNDFHTRRATAPAAMSSARSLKGSSGFGDEMFYYQEFLRHNSPQQPPLSSVMKEFPEITTRFQLFATD